jgi:hypothetical protein
MMDLCKVQKMVRCYEIKNFWSLFTFAASGIFPFFLAGQPRGVLLHRFPPLKPCANEFSLPFSYIKTLARP